MLPILALLLQTAPPPAPAPAPWVVATRPTSDPTITATVTSITSAAGDRLTVRCDAGTAKVVSVQFRSHTALGGPPDRVVDLSVDGTTPISEIWEFAAPPQSVTYSREDQAVTAITNAIAKGKSIKLHTITFAGEPVDATFAGPPSDAPIKAVLAACGYTLGTVPVRAPVKKK